MPREGRAQQFLIDPLAVTRDPVRRAMSPAARGVYDTLWLESWFEKVPGHLPADEAILARLADVSWDCWVAVRDEVRTAFTISADTWVCKGIERTKSEQDRWRTKWRRQKKNQRIRGADSPPLSPAASSDGTGSGSGTGSGAEKTNTPTPRVSPKARPVVEVLSTPSQPPPPGVLPETWTAWFLHRKAIRKPLNELSDKACVKQLTDFYEGGHDPDQIISNAIASGWQGLFIPPEERNGNAAKKR